VENSAGVEQFVVTRDAAGEAPALTRSDGADDFADDLESEAKRGLHDSSGTGGRSLAQ